MQEVFEFVSCADPEHQILWNIESKINPASPNQTLGVQDFVQRQSAVFASSPYQSSITVGVQGFILFDTYSYLLRSIKVSTGEPWSR